MPLTAIAPAPLHPDPGSWNINALTAAWLGHATVLLNIHGSWILTDPALERRIGIGRGVAKFGPRRLVQPALRARELPRLDLILLSHAHMDHTDLGTLRQLPANVPLLGQSGKPDLVRRFDQVHELAWGQSIELDGLRIEATEARHWGARMMTDRHRGYGGFLLQKAASSVLFAGDTAHTDVLTKLRRRGPIDLAVLPIGAYDPWIANHASPEQAWAMFRRLGAEWVLPVHHSTFRLSREPVAEPISRFLAAAGPEHERVVVTEVGGTWSLSR
jgi:L-ascorbate metabolism protein UlaG (beta-lactamase superfamily)